jgi:hypothetical protein
MLIIAAAVLAASLPTVELVRIESSWVGLGKPSQQTYTISHRGDHYERESATVPRAAVDRFAAAITAAPVDRQTALRRIATREWLRGRASEPHDNVGPVCSPEAKRLFAERLADPDSAIAMLDRYFGDRWTDDYPTVAIDVTFSDRHTVHLESSSQPALMLPWKVGGSDTWNPELPRAIVGLLPPDAEPRLTDRHLAEDYVQAVASAMRGRLDDIEERCSHRKFAAAVERQFEIVRVYHGSPDAFTAYVRRTDFPTNLVLTLVISDADRPDAHLKLDRTIQRVNAWVGLARGYVSKHPEKYFAIWCADGVSSEDNDRAVRISEYDPGSGIVSHPRTILPDGTVRDDSD